MMLTGKSLRYRRFAGRLTGAVLCIILCACETPPCPDRLLQCRKNGQKLGEDNLQLKQSLADAQRQITARDGQITNLEGFNAERFKDLVKVEKIELEGLTGPYDRDRDGQADGIVVYLQPIDADGDVIKAAGRIVVTLFDLSGENPRTVGKTEIPADQSGKHWYGRFWTHHFTIHCPFREKIAADVTVEARFVDVLTGKEFTAQKVCQVNRGDGTATTQPAAGGAASSSRSN